MAFKFNEITFDLKDLILIIGVVLYVARFESSINTRFDSIEIKLNKIVGDFTIENIKTNAKIDMLKDKRTSNVFTSPQLVAICSRKDLRFKKLYKKKLI